MDKDDVVPIHNGILFSHKSKRNPAIATTWMDLDGIIAHHMYLAYLWNIKTKQNRGNKTAVDSGTEK